MTRLRLPRNDTVVREARAKRFYGLGLIEIHATVRKRDTALELCSAQPDPARGGRRFVIAHEDGCYSVATIHPRKAARPAAKPRREEAGLFGGAA